MPSGIVYVKMKKFMKEFKEFALKGNVFDIIVTVQAQPIFSYIKLNPFL